MDCRTTRSLVVASSKRLAVNGNHLTVGDLMQSGDPSQQGVLELIGLKVFEDMIETIMTWNALAQIEELDKEFFLGVDLLFDGNKVVTPTDHCTDRHRENVDQRVCDPTGSRIVNLVQANNQIHGRLHFSNRFQTTNAKSSEQLLPLSDTPIAPDYPAWRSRPGLIGGCLNAAAFDPFFPDWEFHTLFGLDRSDVVAVATEWPMPIKKDAIVKLAVQNTLNNLSGYPTRQNADVWDDFVSVDRDQIRPLLERWIESQ